jgi:hypothetical protein
VGTYTNPAYGTIKFCDHSTNSSYCASVLSDFSSLDPTGELPKNQLFAELDHPWVDHMRLTHIEGLKFSTDFSFLFPQGYGLDKTPFDYVLDPGLASAEFVVRDGEVIGFGHFEDPALVRKEDSVEGRADGWFIKVKEADSS